MHEISHRPSDISLFGKHHSDTDVEQTETYMKSNMLCLQRYMTFHQLHFVALHTNKNYFYIADKNISISAALRLANLCLRDVY